MQEVTGTLENWQREQFSNKEFIIWGNIYGDIHSRFKDGTLIRTSGVKNISLKEGDLVQTRNSLYKLGQQYNFGD